MITIKNRIIQQISLYDRYIGVEGDNKVEIRQFLITNPGLFGFDFKLDTQKPSGTRGIIDLVKTVETGRVILTWEILQEHLEAGKLKAQIRAFSGEAEVWHTNIDYFIIGDSINATDIYPEILPSEFSQMESRVTAIQTDITEKAAEVEEDRAEVSTNAEAVQNNTDTVSGLVEGFDEHVQTKTNAFDLNVTEKTNTFDLNATEKTEIVNTKADEASRSAANAKTSEDNAKDSEIEAGKSEDIATQAMLDLLAMLGVDIATLTGGKLTPSQIPAIAITDTFVVADEAAMLALECETGDIAIRTDETKSYILQGTDPSILINWQILKSPTNFADEAGHAATADEAENANKINGHRIVAFKSDETSTGQEKYDNAVIDTEAIYLASSEVI